MLLLQLNDENSLIYSTNNLLNQDNNQDNEIPNQFKNKNKIIGILDIKLNEIKDDKIFYLKQKILLK